MRWGARVNDLHVVAGAQVHIALDAGAGMLWPLALVAVWQEHDQSAGAIPLCAAGADKLVNNNLGPIGKVAELGFPDR